MAPELGPVSSEPVSTVIPMPEPDALLAALDPEQRAVATSLGGPTVVLAGAGTGKTRAITHRIAYAVAIGAYDPAKVLAVTFTTRAAGELRGRLRELGAPTVQARTFHSAALRQAQYFWPRVHGAELPRIADNRMGLVADAAGRARVRVELPALRDLVAEIGWAKVSNVSPDDYAELAAAAGREVSGIEPVRVGHVFAQYERLKADRGVIDFEDILLCTAALLAQDEATASAVRAAYRHLVVDEYQDVSPLQESLLTLWRGERDDLCVVGDPAQTIHSFAGAQASFLTGFANRFPNATRIELVRDYRSSPQVVGVANRLIVGGGAHVSLVAQGPSGPEPVYAEAATEATEAGSVADWLAGLAGAGVPYREMAVLFRINAQSPSFEAALADRGIPYFVRGADGFYDRPEVRQALIVLRGQARAAEDAEPTLPGSAMDSPGTDLAERVRGVLAGLGLTPEAPSGAGAVRERWESLAAVLAAAEDLISGGVGTLPQLAAELDARAAVQHAPRGEGVTLTTFHSAKGLEWDAVALVGVQEGTLPFVLATTPAQLAEERRLLYVGVTRARLHLRISWSRSRARSGGPGRSPSRFLDGIRPATVAPARGRAARRTRVTSAQSQTCRVCGKQLGTAAERKLRRHSGCPAKYDERTLELLTEWRRQTAAEAKLPAYCVFTDATLQAIAEARPKAAAGLLAIAGVGPAKLDRYGEQVLAILGETRKK